MANLQVQRMGQGSPRSPDECRYTPRGDDDRLTILPIGERCDCKFFDPAVPEGDSLKPFCTRFQITPTCTGDLELCDVGWNRPDPREGYR